MPHITLNTAAKINSTFGDNLRIYHQIPSPFPGKFINLLHEMDKYQKCQSIIVLTQLILYPFVPQYTSVFLEFFRFLIFTYYNKCPNSYIFLYIE